MLDALAQEKPLTLDGIYQHVDRELARLGLPRPQRRTVKAAGDLGLVTGPAAIDDPPTVAGPLVGEEYVLANPRRKPLQRAGLVLLWLAILSAPVTWLVNADFLFAHIVPMLIMIGQTGRYDFALTVNGSGLTMGGSDFRRLGYINFCDLSGIGASEFSLDEAIVGVAGRTVFRSDRELIEQDHRLASAPR
ncbi:hypothetical protein AB4225_37550 [Streptomyces sp. 2RAF24]|uniref:hypothetical protein n=1 Tax=Streptomyces sp. 2RAF24 TaxID=3232997 RepID=UPI003F99D71A